MSRLHLFEWEDQPWCPDVFRDYITEHLQFMARLLGFFDVTVDILVDSLNELEATQIVDMCSGGGGPWPSLIDEVASKADIAPQVLLTDLYPNTTAFEKIEKESAGKIKGYSHSASAFDIPGELKGFRTIFTGFHHFKPEHARKILEDAVAKNRGIGIFEAQERSLLMVATIPIGIFFAGLVFTPFVGNLSFKRLFFTYVIPLCPLVMAWDGFASCLRTYSIEELKELTQDLESEHYHFEMGRIPVPIIPFPKIKLTYLIGMPKTVVG
ncbi:MAG: hypothetical protein JKY67_04675 [Pseudomonadales bacterium]|nr:hypothetical protein [Pseudomonadales bacterium]